ncbi:MAG: hypothetical protein R3274_08415, partial [Desulfobacterales bacterium]|nr:hypothetical protein [Desulfobacterales bacterium]
MDKPEKQPEDISKSAASGGKPDDISSAAGQTESTEAAENGAQNDHPQGSPQANAETDTDAPDESAKPA